MSERLFYDILLVGWLVLAAAVFVALFFVAAPYGRHAKRGWGPRIPATVGWVVMEAPSPLGMILLFALGDRHTDPAALALLGLWLLHYLDRAFVYPFRRQSPGQTMPLVVALMAIAFNVGNAYLNGRWLFSFGPSLGGGWLADPRFVVGAALFVTGFAVNRWADQVLIGLRARAGGGYHVPRGGLYRFISCPNYFGETLEWFGWALASWSLGGLAFALWTAANLLPRAAANHRWYRQRFPDYPAERKAVVPFLW